MIYVGWPEPKSQVSDSLLPFYDVQNDLAVQDSHFFNVPLIVIPSTLRKRMMYLVHSIHIGTECCLRSACDIMF